MTVPKTAQYTIVSDQETLERVFQYLEQNEFVAFDIETDSVDEKTARVIGIAVTCYPDEGIYIPLAVWNKTIKQLEPLYKPQAELDLVKRLCKILLTKKLIMHNGVFDIACIFNAYKVDLTSALHADTILMEHTVNEEGPFALKVLAVKYFGEGSDSEQQDLRVSVEANGGKWTKGQKDIYMGDLELIGKYAAADTDLTIKLFDLLSDRLDQENLHDFFYEKEVMPLYRLATIPMKLNGMAIDVEYFQSLKKELNDDIIKLTEEVFNLIREKIEPKVREILDKNIKSSRQGKFGQKVLQYYSLPVPLHKKTGKPTLAKSALQSLLKEYPGHQALKWLLWEAPKVKVEEEVLDQGTDKVVASNLVEPEIVEPKLPEEVIYEIKKEMWVEDGKGPYVFNLASTQHIAWLLFEAYGEEPVEYSRETGEPKVDQDILHRFDLPFIKPFLELKKQQKILNTYVEPILRKNRNGWIYPSMKQHGTTSGRYSCGSDKESQNKVAKDVNFQTLPRDDKRIKKGFIAPKGYKIVNADFQALEPRIFAWVSGDENLKDVFRKGLDLYSHIGIEVFELEDCSDNPEDKNYLKIVNPKKRDETKEFALAVPYGANAWRIAQLLSIPIEDAQEIIKRYLNRYPSLRDYMNDQEFQAYKTGRVYTDFGRIRHLDEAKQLYSQFGGKLFNKRELRKFFSSEKEANETYYKFRNYLNNAKNAPIQGTAAHVTNAALIKLALLFKEYKIDGWTCLQTHDEITCIVREDQAALAADLLKDSMENNWVTEKIDVPMISEPTITDDLASAK